LSPQVIDRIEATKRVKTIEDLIHNEDLLVELVVEFFPYSATLRELTGNRALLKDLVRLTPVELIRLIIETSAHEDSN